MSFRLVTEGFEDWVQLQDGQELGWTVIDISDGGDRGSAGLADLAD